MTKFELINGQHCRMVEPKPLTPEAAFPCVVRLIQDDSPMGLYHKDLFRMDKDEYNPKICNEVRSLSDLSDSNRGSVIHSDGIISAQYYHFEIIGYPVEEGSHWWAFYQHKQGHVLSNHKHCVFRHKFRSDDTAWECIKIYQDGWIIDSEPKPLLAGAKVGDWVEYRLDSKAYYGEISEIRDHAYYLSVTTEDISSDQARAIHLSNIVRKLDPSEVRVKIGCLEGLVRFDSAGAFRLVMVDDPDEWSTIAFRMLDPDTAKLVRELVGK